MPTVPGTDPERGRSLLLIRSMPCALPTFVSPFRPALGRNELCDWRLYSHFGNIQPRWQTCDRGPCLNVTPSRHAQMNLEKVIGNTIKGTCGVAVNPVTGDVAYPAGCVVVFYSPKRHRQTQFLSCQNNRWYSSRPESVTIAL